jgi:hypothetical protein
MLRCNCWQLQHRLTHLMLLSLTHGSRSRWPPTVSVSTACLSSAPFVVSWLLEALRVAPTAPEARRARSLALIANDLLPNALVAISHAERLVQVAALDCVALAAECSPPIVDVAAVCAKIAAFVASGDARSAVFAFRLIAALQVPIDDGDNVCRLLTLFDNALECSAAGFERFFSADVSAVEWRVPLLAALKTALHLTARHGRFASERMWTWLLPQCIALRSEIAGDASGGIVLAALTLLAAFGRCANSGWHLRLLRLREQAKTCDRRR